MDAPLVTLADVHRTYKRGDEVVNALRGVSFDVQRGDFVVVTGPSGSGKSTLLHVIAGLDRPTQGEVRLEGKPINDMPDDELTLYRRRRLGFIFQFFHLLPTLSAAENVALPLLLDGKSPGEATEVARVKLTSLGLSARAEHRPRELSGGEQQRVAIARAFMNRPKILFADEPTGNLDAETAGEIIKLIFDLNATRGTTLLLVTHDRELSQQATRTIRLRGGKLVSDSNDSAISRSGTQSQSA